jgi:hypothetical protein
MRRKEALDLSRKHNFLILEGEASSHISLPHAIISELIPSCMTPSYDTRRSLLLHVLWHPPAHRILFHARSTNRGSQRRTRTTFRQLQQNPLFRYPHGLRDWARTSTRRNRSTCKSCTNQSHHFTFSEGACMCTGRRLSQTYSHPPSLKP